MVSSNTERGVMEMDNLLDLLAKARVDSGITGIVQKPREEQAEILEQLMHKFDAAKNMEELIKDGPGLKRKGTDPEKYTDMLRSNKKVL